MNTLYIGGKDPKYSTEATSGLVMREELDMLLFSLVSLVVFKTTRKKDTHSK